MDVNCVSVGQDIAGIIELGPFIIFSTPSDP